MSLKGCGYDPSAWVRASGQDLSPRWCGSVGSAWVRYDPEAGVLGGWYSIFRSTPGLVWLVL